MSTKEAKEREEEHVSAPIEFDRTAVSDDMARIQGRTPPIYDDLDINRKI